MSTPLPTFRMDARETPEIELTRKLLGYLLSGELEPGQKIPAERALSETLGVGRGAVRNSIKSLALLGLLEQRQGDGTYLARTESEFLPKVIEWGMLLGQQKLTDLIELRETMEIALAGMAAERRTPEQLAEIRDLVTQMSVTSSTEVFIDVDIRFHLAIARASGNPVMANILSNVQALLRAWVSRVIETAGETESSVAVHKAVLEAIEESDPQRAREAMTAHMERATRRLLASLPSGDQDDA